MPKLYMLLIGCKPEGRHTEQHDVYFGIAESIKELLPELIVFWPEAKGKIHIDGWREVTNVSGQTVSVVPKATATEKADVQLYFINLGGYKPNEFEEFHYKMIVAAADKSEAITQSKKTAFYMHTGFKGATSHIDDKYGVDVDDLYELEEILSNKAKEKYKIIVQKSDVALLADELHLGYFKLNSFN